MSMGVNNAIQANNIYRHHENTFAEIKCVEQVKNIIKLPQELPKNQSLSSIPKQLAEINDAAKLIHDAKVIGECYRVRVLFDTEALKSDKDYISIIEDTWLRTFKDTDPELLEEAVQDFIVSDKKGYLPKPGQIVELLVKGIKDIERKRYWENIERLERQRLFAEYGIKDE